MTSAAVRSPASVARHTGYNLAGQLLPLMVAVLALPVVVRHLGAARFGLLALAWTLVNYVGLVDLGFGRAATRRIATLTGTAETGSIGSVARSVAALQFLLGLAGGFALYHYSGPLAGWLVPGEAAPLRTEGMIMLRVLALALPAVLLSNAYRAVLEGLTRFDLVNAVRAPFTAALFLIPLAGAWAGWDVVTIVAGLAVSRWLAAAAYYTAYLRARPAGVSRLDVAELATLARFGSWVAVSSLLIPAVIYLERVAISALRGPESLGFYAAPHELMLKLLILPAALASVLYPMFSEWSVGQQTLAMGRGLVHSARVVAVAMAPIAAAFAVLAEPLLASWLGPGYVVGGSALRLLAAAAFLNSLALVPFVLIEGSGRPDVIAKYHVFELPVYAVFLWFMVGRFGLTGAAAAWLVRVAIMTAALYALALRAVGWRAVAPASRRAMGAVLAGVATVAAAAVWGSLASTTGAFVGVLIPIAHAVLSWYWLLERSERTALVDALRKARPARARTA